MGNAYCIPGQVANFFLSKRNHDIDNLKLNKLLFISLGCGLALSSINKDKDKQLFSEDVQAWAYGPVVPSIYHEFKHFGRNKITDFSEITDFKGNSFVQKEPTIDDDADMTSDDKELIKGLLEKVWEVYGKKTPLQLVGITHKSGAPWSQVYSQDKMHIVIPRSTIKEYYEAILQ